MRHQFIEGVTSLTEKSQRLKDLQRFYAILDNLRDNANGAHLLSECNGAMDWSDRGVYFFHENGESRSDTGSGLRVVRVGTHALISKSKRMLWERLRAHRGAARTGGGNHRGSIFRLLVGTAAMDVHNFACPTWGVGKSAPKDTRQRQQERPLEKQVSQIIGQMPFIYVAVTDQPGPESRRGYIERNAIALLSNYGKPPLDAPSLDWLGDHCDSEKVRLSGLWNQNHVGEDYDPAFLNELEMWATKMR